MNADATNEHLRGPSTRAVEAGRREEWTGPVVNPPVWRASTHLYKDSADIAKARPNEDGNFYYGRRGAPTQWALAEALTQLEPGATGTQLYPSGVAAIANVLMAILKPGDEVLFSDNSYEPSRGIALNLLKRYGISARAFDPSNVDGFGAMMQANTKAVLFEAPGSLTMEMCDIPTFAEIARNNGALCLIDNTWATSLGFPALERGCDISIMSLTKHVGGHSDLMMGSASASGALFTRLRHHAQAMGQVVSPDDAALALRGLRTMPLRLEKTAASALEIATWLKTRDEVAHILCPMMEGAPGHDIWTRDFTGGCGLFSFVLKGRDPAAQARFIDALNLFGIGYSWGGFESLVIPFDPERARTATPWPPKGWEPEDRHGIRLSIGLEDTADLLQDLSQAFDAMDKI